VTKRLNITLPDDVAAHLEGVANASAYIAEAINLRRRTERSREMLARHGITVTDEGIQAAGDKLRAAEDRRRNRPDSGHAA